MAEHGLATCGAFVKGLNLPSQEHDSFSVRDVSRIMPILRVRQYEIVEELTVMAALLHTHVDDFVERLVFLGNVRSHHSSVSGPSGNPLLSINANSCNVIRHMVFFLPNGSGLIRARNADGESLSIASITSATV